MFISTIMKRIGALGIKVILECEHCHNDWESQVEDSDNYRNSILPNLHCTSCNKTGLDSPSKKLPHHVSNNCNGIIDLGLKRNRRVISHAASLLANAKAMEAKKELDRINFNAKFDQLFATDYQELV